MLSHSSHLQSVHTAATQKVDSYHRRHACEGASRAAWGEGGGSYLKLCELSVTDADPPIAPDSDVIPDVIPSRCDGVAPLPMKLLLLVAPPLASPAWPWCGDGCATEITDAEFANGSDPSP